MSIVTASSHGICISIGRNVRDTRWATADAVEIRRRSAELIVDLEARRRRVWC